MDTLVKLVVIRPSDCHLATCSRRQLFGFTQAWLTLFGQPGCRKVCNYFLKPTPEGTIQNKECSSEPTHLTERDSFDSFDRQCLHSRRHRESASREVHRSGFSDTTAPGQRQLLSPGCGFQSGLRDELHNRVDRQDTALHMTPQQRRPPHQHGGSAAAAQLFNAMQTAGLRFLCAAGLLGADATSVTCCCGAACWRRQAAVAAAGQCHGAHGPRARIWPTGAAGCGPARRR